MSSCLHKLLDITGQPRKVHPADPICYGELGFSTKEVMGMIKK
jgi:hypothetical protein